VVVDPPVESLASLTEGTERHIVRVEEDDPELLRYLASCGLVPGAKVRVLTRGPFDEPIHIRIDGREQAIGQRVARAVYVERHHPEE
ncbi:MAG: ferrous iron transport protein A, partial [Clostridia bacterium]|nr:ferrous iron transport protein A [Clostridia bacterium]